MSADAVTQDWSLQEHNHTVSSADHRHWAIVTQTLVCCNFWKVIDDVNI